MPPFSRPWPTVWHELAPSPVLCSTIANALGVSPTMAAVLLNRGLTDPESAAAFLDPRLASLSDPSRLRDMDRAVARILQALQNHESIALYGDYDADGMTSTALLVTFFRMIGVAVEAFVPDRQRDGYGLNADRVRELALRGIRLLITLDCGTRSLDEARLAASLGMDLVVIDHHEVGPELPDVAALVNPCRADCTFPFKHLASVGLAFYFAGALRRALAGADWPGPLPDLRDLLDLVALGTVADIVPLVQDNRVFTTHGLRRINQRPRFGMAALCAVSDLGGRPVTAGNIAFQLAPRLNAAGRLGDAHRGVALLLARDAEEAKRLAEQLDRDNADRRIIEAEVLAAAMTQIGPDGPAHRAVVVAGRGWHPGVVGIVASRLVDQLQRPAVVIAIDPDGLARGSCRSVPGLDMDQALERVRAHLVQFGGHPMAAGVTLLPERIDAFREAFETVADEMLQDVPLGPNLRIEATLAIRDVAVFAPEAERLQPHGMGNPEPVFAFRAVTLIESRRVGRDQSHLQVRFRDEQDTIAGIWFRAGATDFLAGERVDVAASVFIDDTSRAPRLKVRDMRRP